jgi:hypothetical protein
MAGKKRKERLPEAEAYLRIIQPLMGLAHWHFRVDPEPPGDPQCSASIHCYAMQAHAVLRFNKSYFAGPPEWRRYCMVHELAHCHLNQLAQAEEAYEHATDELSYRHLHTRWRHEEEVAVDSIARVLAPFLPLPPGGE